MQSNNSNGLRVLGSSNDHLFTAVLLHLPLNVVWRLPGWNHLLHKRLMNDHLWRLKVEMEFPLFLNKIPNYRLYYLMGSTNCYGNLYCNNQLDARFQRVRAVSIIGATKIVWAGNNLYSFTNDEQPRVVATGVTHYRDDFVHINGKSYELHGSDGDYTPVEVDRELLVNYESEWAHSISLYRDGTLLVKFYEEDYSPLGEVKLFSVVSAHLQKYNHNRLIVLHRDGIVRVYFISVRSITVVLEDEYKDQTMIDASSMYNCSEVTHVSDYHIKRTLVRPIRKIHYQTRVMIEIDGQGRLLDHPILWNERMNYRGVISCKKMANDYWVVASALV